MRSATPWIPNEFKNPNQFPNVEYLNCILSASLLSSSMCVCLIFVVYSRELAPSAWLSLNAQCSAFDTHQSLIRVLCLCVCVLCNAIVFWSHWSRIILYCLFCVLFRYTMYIASIDEYDAYFAHNKFKFANLVSVSIRRRPVRNYTPRIA